MNPDKLEGNQVCAASSNRNFKGRQGSPTGRTLLMSPAMVAAAALAGEVTDVRKARQLMRKITARIRARRCRCAATTSTPIASCRRGSSARSPSMGSSSTSSRTTARAAAHPYNRHPFDVGQFQGASVLVVNANFGCGSSREHAPQGLQRWGINAVVGESFAEIFFGNSVMIGLPCVTASPDDVRTLMELDRAKSARPRSASTSRPAPASPGTCAARCRFRRTSATRCVTGAWDTTGLLLDRYEEVDAASKRLPYVSGF